MNFKTTIGLLFVLLGVGTYLFFTRSGGEGETAKPSAATAAKLVDIRPEDVTKLAILPASGKPVVFEKSGADWKMVQPIQAPAETFEVDGLVRDVVTLQSRGQMDAGKKSSAGLDNPPYTIEVTAKDKTTKIQVGEKPPFGDDLAVLVAGKDKPDVVSASIVSKLEKKPSTYRKTAMVNVTTDQIKQLAISRKNQPTIRLEKTGSDWQITEPKKMPADNSAVDSLLFGVTGLRASSFEDDLSPDDAGLSKPREVVWYSTQAPATQPAAPTTAPATAPTTQLTAADLPGGTTIRIGAPVVVGSTDIYASVTGGPVAKVSASTFDTFKKTPLELRDRKVVDIDSDRVESLTIDINRPATTQPTTKPAEHRYFVIERRKEDRTLGPAIPPAPATPATQPAATTPTASAAPTTEPATSPATLPAALAAASTTQPAGTQPATAPAVAAATQPAAPPSKWVFRSGGEGDADEGQVRTFLESFHPLRADKFLESPTTQPAAGTILLTIRTGPGATSGPGEYTLRFTDPGDEGKLTGTYTDLVFEADRAIARNADGDFKTKKAEPPTPPPGGGFPSLPGGHPPIPGFGR